MVILTEKEFGMMNQISFECVYKNPRIYSGKTMCSAFSTSLDYHFQIISKMMSGKQIPETAKISQLLLERDSIAAQMELPRLGDMAARFIRDELSFEGIGFFTCPEVLVDNQILRLRMWYEYYLRKNCPYSIMAIQDQEFVSYENLTEIKNYLQAQKVLDDEYILAIKKKHPDYYC